MNYDHDMPPYIQEMADWLDDDSEVHPCNFASAYQGFEIMMALVPLGCAGRPGGAAAHRARPTKSRC